MTHWNLSFSLISCKNANVCSRPCSCWKKRRTIFTYTTRESILKRCFNFIPSPNNYFKKKRVWSLAPRIWRQEFLPIGFWWRREHDLRQGTTSNHSWTIRSPMRSTSWHCCKAFGHNDWQYYGIIWSLVGGTSACIYAASKGSWTVSIFSDLW